MNDSRPTPPGGTELERALEKFAHPEGFCPRPAGQVACACSPPSTTKPTNPKDAIGSSKVPFSLVPDQVVGEIALALLEGACKYGSSNWRVAGVRASVYLDAARRHLAQFREGQDIDALSGLSHITKAIAGLVVLRDSMLQGNWVDDRLIRSTNLDWVDEQNALAKAMLAKFPEPKQPCTQIPGVLAPAAAEPLDLPFVPFTPKHAASCKDQNCDRSCMRSPAHCKSCGATSPSLGCPDCR